MPRPIIITASLLRHAATCDRRVWLDTFVEPDAVTLTPVALLRGVEHEAAVQAATSRVIDEIEVYSWDEGVSATQELMRDGAAAISGAYLEQLLELENGTSVTLRGRVDRLVYDARTGCYQPIEIKQYAELNEADRLQLDFYVYLLQQMQGARVEGTFWLGKDADNQPRYVLTHVYNSGRLQGAMRKALTTLQRASAPAVRLEPHCRECPWHDACVEFSRATLDLGLLPRLSRQARSGLERHGITSLNQLASLSVEELQRIKGIKATAVTHRASAIAYVENRPVWVKPLPDVLHGGGWMFDLETAALPGGDGMPWSLGWCDEAGNSQIAVVAPEQPRQTFTLPSMGLLTVVADKDEAWEVFYEAMCADDKPIYHWSGFDAGVMKATAPARVKAALLGRMHDLHHTFVNTVRLPLRSYSIKKVAPYFGFNWSGHAEWWAAETDYRRWLATGDTQFIAQACGYQRDDVLALAIIWRWLVENHENGL